MPPSIFHGDLWRRQAIGREKWRMRYGYFSVGFAVYITVWKTRWKMCKTLCDEQIMKVTGVLWETLRNNIMGKTRKGTGRKFTGAASS